MKAKTVKKAFRVWVHSMIGEYPVFDPKDLEVVYADTAAEAKNEICIIGEKNSHGDDAKWIDIKCQRAKEYDKVEYNDKVITRFEYAYRLEEEKRNTKLRGLDENDHYYVQDARSYVGNSVIWWAEGGGYTTDITKAHKYIKEGILKSFLNGRVTDIIWSAEHVETKIKQHIDVQYLDKKYCI